MHYFLWGKNYSAQLFQEITETLLKMKLYSLFETHF